MKGEEWEVDGGRGGVVGGGLEFGVVDGVMEKVGGLGMVVEGCC